MQELKLKPLTVQREQMSPMVRRYWSDIDQAHELGNPVVYCLGNAPQEIFRTVDHTVFFGENFGAACAVARVSQELCDVAESRGFPIELCSYIRTNIGAMATGRNPMGKALPKPDIVAYVNQVCASYAGWGKMIKELYPDAILLSLDVPKLWDGMTKDDYAEAQRYVIKQIEEWIAAIDGWHGRRFDRDVFGGCVENTGRSARAFMALQDVLKTKPAPISLIDVFFQLFPMVSLKGRAEVADYYVAATAEAKQRIADGYSAVPEEKLRIYWDGIAIWTRLSKQYQQLAAHNAALVSSIYAYSMAYNSSNFDGKRPLESIADALLLSYMNVTVKDKLERVVELIKDWYADGIIMQISRSCKSFFVDEQLITKQAAEIAGVPYVMVQGDMADPRLYSEQEIETRIDAFLERLAKG